MTPVRLLKGAVRRVMTAAGHDFERATWPGRDPVADMRSFTVAGQSPVIFDVGGNTGQTLTLFNKGFPGSTIHTFEPNPAAFAQLSQTARSLPRIHLNNIGLASEPGEKTFVENARSDMSSFLEPDGWGDVVARPTLPLTTVDEYCETNNVEFIDILKSDTQGYDTEVLKGARRMMREHRIHMVYVELIFSHMYVGMPKFYEIPQLLADEGFDLVTFYEMNYSHRRLSWTDALFIDPAYVPAQAKG